MSLTHEVPTALRTRPMVAIRQIPGKVFRVPARGGTIMLGALILWGIAVAVLHLPWETLASLVLVPAALLMYLVEGRPRGKTPLTWVYITFRHVTRPHILIGRRVMTAKLLRRHEARW